MPQTPVSPLWYHLTSVHLPPFREVTAIPNLLLMASIKILIPVLQVFVSQKISSIVFYGLNFKK